MKYQVVIIDIIIEKQTVASLGEAGIPRNGGLETILTALFMYASPCSYGSAWGLENKHTSHGHSGYDVIMGYNVYLMMYGKQDS